MKHAKSVLGSAIALTLLSGCGSSNSGTPVPSGIATASGYSISVFAQAPSSTSRPDSIEQMGNTVFIAYQNAGEVKDGSVPGVQNAVVQYDLSGNVMKTYSVPGHVDGLLARTDTSTLWAMANEDGNPELTIIDLVNGSQITYQATVNPTAHGGGYDDMQLINGVVYVTASNPAAPGVAPTVVSLTLNKNGTTFDVTPVLAGNAQATDITPSIGGSANPNLNKPVTLNLSDPDSEGIDTAGDLVVDSQADGKLVFILNPGASQKVSVLSLTLYNDKDGATVPVDDTRWVPAPGTNGTLFMLITDGFGTTYRIDSQFILGSAYSNGQDMVMQLDVATGHLTPVVAGLGSGALQDPHGMAFITN